MDSLEKIKILEHKFTDSRDQIKILGDHNKILQQKLTETMNEMESLRQKFIEIQSTLLESTFQEVQSNSVVPDDTQLKIMDLQIQYDRQKFCFARTTNNSRGSRIIHALYELFMGTTNNSRNIHQN